MKERTPSYFLLKIGVRGLKEVLLGCSLLYFLPRKCQ
jgi:hypothetical protein